MNFLLSFYSFVLNWHKTKQSKEQNIQRHLNSGDTVSGLDEKLALLFVCFLNVSCLWILYSIGSLLPELEVYAYIICM